ncbi:cytochrome P450 71A1-like [Salvia splendens]|uniref:cytochrome P450 71A1-like n=1 Tax=Salvia splendens TaxID=180675 RepID=UPI001C27C6F2|nr:cytochrome P450 71A1-like [Salvia splendens]
MMSLILLLWSLPIILILYFQLQKPKNGNKLRPPGPPGLPIIGNMLQIDGQFPHKYFQRLSKQYGPVMFLRLGIRPLVVISSVETVKEISKSYDAIFSGRPSLVAMDKLSYNNIDIGFSDYNDTWREMRKISTLHLFSTKQVQSSHSIFRDEVRKMMEKIGRDASSSTVINFSEMATVLLNNIMVRLVFGIYGGDRLNNLASGVQSLYAGFFVGDYLPWFRWIDSLSGMAARLDKTFHMMDSFCQELIEEHMKPNRPKSMEGDFIDILLRIKENGSSSLTLNHIKAALVDMVTGGNDSVASVILWTMTALMKKPSVMKKLQEEIRRSVGKKDMIDKQDIEKVPYLRAVIKEGMRLYPPAPLSLPRKTTDKCSVNGYEIEAGTMVYMNLWAIGRDPAAWENADEFLPERFLEDQTPDISFGFGRRGCPGNGMAMAEMELAFANLLYKFNWELPVGMKEDDIDFESAPGTAMHKKNDLCLVAKVVI